MGVPIQSSREIRSNRRLPLPRKLHEVLGQFGPDGTCSSFWNFHTGFKIMLLTNRPLLDLPLKYRQFQYSHESEYLGEKHSNGDWDIRPKNKILSELKSDFENDRFVYYLYRNEWLEREIKGVYILTTSDLLRLLPKLKEMGPHFSHIATGDTRLYGKRPQEAGKDSNLQINSLIELIQRSAISELEELVDSVYTTGYIETDLELPFPETSG